MRPDATSSSARALPSALDLRGLRIVVDCANGAGYQTAPNVFHELGADVIPLGVSPTGTNINDRCGATDTEALQREVVAQRADLGIAIDGDADRVMMVDATGRLYDGDALLYAIVRDRAQRERVEGVAGTLMTNLGLEQAFERMGCRLCACARRRPLRAGDAAGKRLALRRRETRATSCASTATPPATERSVRCRCSLRCAAPARRSPRPAPASSSFRRR